jgi:hypothetical protein
MLLCNQMKTVSEFLFLALSFNILRFVADK